MTAPADRVWEIVGNPGTTPGRGIVVEVERPAAENGSGLVRAVRIGRGTFREQITSVGPGRRLTYRLLSGAPRSRIPRHGRCRGVGRRRQSWPLDRSLQASIPGDRLACRGALEAVAEQGARPGRDANETGTPARRRRLIERKGEDRHV